MAHAGTRDFTTCVQSAQTRELLLFNQFNSMPVRVCDERDQAARWRAIWPVLEGCTRRQYRLDGKLEVRRVKGDVIGPIEPHRCDRTRFALNELQAGIRSGKFEDGTLETLNTVGHVFFQAATEREVKSKHVGKLAGAARDVMVGQFHAVQSIGSPWDRWR